MPGSPTTSAKLALASHRPLPAPSQEVEFLLAPDERGQGAGAQAPAAARAHDPKQRRRLRRAFQRMRAAFVGDEEPCHLTLNIHGDEH